MNHFAHLVLAQPTVSSAVGNLLGDFMRGVSLQSLSQEIRRGLDNHREVDRYTDQDDQIRSLKTLFSPQRRRFAGVALDIYFDHLLIRYWEELESGTALQSIEQSYRYMQSGQELMPSSKMRRITTLMVENDWFGHYRDTDSVGRAIDRVASRIRFKHQFDNILEEILLHEDEITDRFLVFYPRLKAHIKALGIERPGDNEE